MTKTEHARRPLSPHLQIYRPMLTMMMSIFHRATGMATAVGVVLLVWWLSAAATSDAYFDMVQRFFGHWFGRIVLFGFTWALVHHALGGLRHLLWDTGRGFESAGGRDDGACHDHRVGGRHHPAVDHRLWDDAMSMRTPLGRVRGLGSAKSGTEHWWLQRVTAIANIPLVIFLVIFVIRHLGASRAEIVASIANPFVAILLALTFVSVLWHMRLGLQVVIEDYVHGHVAKFAALLANSFVTVLLGVAALYAILKMSFGL